MNGHTMSVALSVAKPNLSCLLLRHEKVKNVPRQVISTNAKGATLLPTITERFPPLPLKELSSAISNFQASPLSDQLALITRLVVQHPTLSLNWGPGHIYRRARVLKPEEVLPTNVDGFIWRKDVPATLMRANPEGFPVMYLADHPDTALKEVRATNSRVVLAEFEIQAGKQIRLAPIGEMMKIQRTGRGYLSGDASSTLNDFLNACEPDSARSLLITDSFLFDCLAKQDNYQISSHVAKCIFDKDPAISVISYPSYVQHGAMNFAVRTEAFWESWGVRAVRCVHAKHLAQGYYGYSQIRHVSGITVRGNLVWSDEVENLNASLHLEPLWFPTMPE